MPDPMRYAAPVFTYGSVCSGIEAATVAWHPLGWRPSFFSEIAPFPRAVLRHHYPDVPCHGDFTTIRAGDYDAIDLLVGGTPCQSFSVAGLRGGLADQRGNLALQFLALAHRLRPRWIVWENVPGVLSSTSHDAPDPRAPPDDLAEGSEWIAEDEYDADESHAFACFLAGLSELGYGWAYRSFDAQYFGLAQRRERVFAIGHLGDWRPAAAVLFEPASLRGHPPPRREARQDAAPTLAARTRSGGGLGTDFDCDGGLIADGIAACLTRREGKGPDSDATTTLIAHALRAEGFDASEDGTGRGTPLVAAPLTRGADSAGAGGYAGRRREDDTNLVLTLAIRGRGDSHDLEYREDGIANAVLTPGGGRGGVGVGAVNAGMAVRRLTPRECGRLQGFPDGYLDIVYRGRPAADAPKYQALGNSFPVPCMAWIGRRIARIEGAAQRRAAA